MNRARIIFFACAAVAGTASAQNWSFGAATGPFVFGDFVRRTLRTGTETGTGEQTTKLSAKTRPGLSIDIERKLAPRIAVRLEGTFTHAPLAIKGRSDSGVALDAGTLNVGTAMVPFVVRLNPNGSFRFHLMGGPAYAVYNIRNRSNATSTLRTFTGSRTRWGFAAGGGVAWQVRDRFAIEGQLTDISTKSPFRKNEFPANALARIEIPRTHNVHTTIGIRYGF
jgi:opacity protein-like surface antigen